MRLLRLDETKATNLRYQLLHRTAAALIEASRFNARYALMVLYSFSPADAWFEDYAAFAREVEVKAAVDKIVRVGDRHGLELSIGWVKGDPAYLEV